VLQGLDSLLRELLVGQPGLQHQLVLRHAVRSSTSTRGNACKNLVLGQIDKLKVPDGPLVACDSTAFLLSHTVQVHGFSGSDMGRQVLLQREDVL
jgi:hypothetical protein